METIKTLYRRFSHAFETALELLSVVIIGVTTLMICVEVVARVFGSTSAILEEGPRLFFCYAVLPMIGVVYKRGRHINVEYLPEKLKGRRKIFLMLAIDAVMVTSAIVLLMTGILGTKALYLSGMRIVGVLDLPEFILMLSVPIGGGILLLYTLEVLVFNVASLFATKACANIDP